MILNTKAGFIYFINLKKAFLFSILFFLCLNLVKAQGLYNINSVAKEFEKDSDTVKVGSYIINVHDINFHDKEYTIRFWLWFLYDNPDFDFATQVDVPNAKTIEEPQVITDTIGGKIWVLLKMKCTMKQNWKVNDFPFDKQHLRVQIENALYDHSSLVFLPDTLGSNYDRELTIDGWDITDFHVSRGKNDYETAFGDPRTKKQFSEYDSFFIDLNLERDALGLFLKIFVGMYIAFLIAIVSFTIHPSEVEPRFGLPVGGLFAAVGNKYIIDSLLPESSSFSLVDSLHTLTFFCIFGTIVVSALALRKEEKGRNATAFKINRWGSRIVVGLYIVVNLILITQAIL